MEISFDREHMAEALQRVASVAEKRSTMPILNNVHLQHHEQGLQLDTTDLELAWTVMTRGTHLGDSAASMNCAVNAKKFLEIVKSAPAGENIKLSLEQDRLLVEFARSHFALQQFSGADFPEWKPEAVEHSLEMPQHDLKQLIESTQFAMAIQDVRFYLQGLLVIHEGSVFKTVATDGHRLAYNALDVEGKSAEAPRQCIIPRKTILELRRNLTDDAEPVVLDFCKGQVIFRFGNAQLKSKLIEGQFPDYQRVIPASWNSTLIIDREVLKRSLSRVAIVTSDKFRGVTLELDENGGKLSAYNPEHEVAEDVLQQCDYQGEALSISFNLPYLLDILGAIDSEQVWFGFQGTMAPVLIRSGDASQAQYVVMPTRI